MGTFQSRNMVIAICYVMFKLTRLLSTALAKCDVVACIL